MEDGVESILKDGIVSLHSGVYRVEIHKFLGTDHKSKKKG